MEPLKELENKTYEENSNFSPYNMAETAQNRKTGKITIKFRNPTRRTSPYGLPTEYSKVNKENMAPKTFQEQSRHFGFSWLNEEISGTKTAQKDSSKALNTDFTTHENSTNYLTRLQDDQDEDSIFKNDSSPRVMWTSTLRFPFEPISYFILKSSYERQKMLSQRAADELAARRERIASTAIAAPPHIDQKQ